MKKATWLTRLWWWITGENKLQVHEAPELTGYMDDEELTEEVLSEIFSGVINQVIGEVNA